MALYTYCIGSGAIISFVEAYVHDKFVDKLEFFFTWNLDLVLH